MLIHRHNHHDNHSTPNIPVLNSDNNTEKSPPPPSKWQKRLESLARKVAIPLNSLATGRGCESFVPMTMEEECAKAARILWSFSQHSTSPTRTTTGTGNASTTSQSISIVTIPPASIASAAGVLIFTTGRLGFSRLSGSTGSGILITRRDQHWNNDTAPSSGPESESAWNLPVAIQAHGVGLGPLALGFDVSDRVYLVRSRDGLDTLLNRGQFVVGPEVVLAVGKWGGGAGLTFSGSFRGVQREEVSRAREGGWGRGRDPGCSASLSGTCRHCQNHDGKGDSYPSGQQIPSQTTEDHGHENENEKSWEAISEELDEKSALLPVVDLHQKQPTESVDDIVPSHLSSGHKQQQSESSASGRASRPPIHCYMRSHGFYAGLQAEGTVFSELGKTNAEFYGPASGTMDERGGDHDQAWRDGAGTKVRAVEAVWEALRELEFGPRDSSRLNI